MKSEHITSDLLQCVTVSLLISLLSGKFPALNLRELEMDYYTLKMLFMLAAVGFGSVAGIYAFVWMLKQSPGWRFFAFALIASTGALFLF